MTLLELLSLLRKQWQLLVVLPVVFCLATGAVCWGFMADQYTAKVSLYVLTSNANNNSNTISSGDVTTSQQLANDMAALIKSDLITDATAKKLGLDDLDDYKMSVSSQTTNRVINISVIGHDPASVASVANEIAAQASKSATEIMKMDAVNVIDSAKVPTSPSGPKRLQYMLIALLAGLFVAVALIALRDMIDNTVKSPEHAEELFGLPVIGRMPEIKGLK